MASNQERSKSVLDIDPKLSITLLGYAYAILLGGSYLVAFWEPFGFNIFPYLALKDFVTVPFVAVTTLIFPALMYVGVLLARHQLAATPGWFHGLLVPTLAFAVYRFGEALFIFLRLGAFQERERLFLFVIASLALLACVLGWKSRRLLGTNSHAVLALGLGQMASVMALGYCDGKRRFSDEGPRQILQQSGLCSGPEYGRWIYVDKYGDDAIFINSVDKRLCLINEFRFNLVDSRIDEALGS